MNADLLSAIINWLPMLAIVALWIFYIWWIRNRYQRDYMALIAKQTEAIERVAAALERKSTNG
jgi:hypothetical protein